MVNNSALTIVEGLPMPASMEKAVQVALPIELVLDMFRRADRFDVDSGGRYDRRGSTIIVWSANFVANDRTSETQGTAYFHWRSPTEGQATLWKLEWDPAEGGSEEELWVALEVLAGRSLRPDAPPSV